MTTRPNFIALALGVAMGLTLSVAPAMAENRPSDGVIFTKLNGEFEHQTGPDAGGLALSVADAGVGCMDLLTGATYEMHCNAGAHFCPWSDGGLSCSSSVHLATYGRPVAASTTSAPAPYFFTVEGNSTAAATKRVCIAPASGSAAATCALFKMR